MMTEHTVTRWIIRSLLLPFNKMLNPSSPAQKSLYDEDGSSGSDAGSEAGLEPETDRFGFIVTNGSTAGWAVPLLYMWTVKILTMRLALLQYQNHQVYCFSVLWHSFSKKGQMVERQIKAEVSAYKTRNICPIQTNVENLNTKYGTRNGYLKLCCQDIRLSLHDSHGQTNLQ